MEALLAVFTYDPIQRIGPVSPHGIGTAIGFLAGAVLMARRAEPHGIPRAETYNAVTWGAVGALIGARAFYVIGHLGQFSSFGDVFAVWQGGLTMFGGFIGGLALGLWYMRRNGFSITQTLDAAAPGFVIGVIVGRVGDILIADHLGRRTDSFLGYRIPAAELAPGYGPPTYAPGVVVHHTAVYDLIGAVALLVALYVVERRKPRPPGALFATFALWYGLQRFLIDFTRNRELIESYVLGLSGSQWAGLVFAAGGAYALWRSRDRDRSKLVGEMPPPSPVPAGSAPDPSPPPHAETPGAPHGAPKPAAPPPPVAPPPGPPQAPGGS